MLANLAVMALASTIALGADGSASDPRRTLTVDAVLLARGQEAAGASEFTVVHGAFTYQFATAQTREEFLRDPGRYEIGFNGACARMGPLSGGGDARRWAVHDGRVYVFASESCRQTFLDHADDLLERDDRPLFPAACEEAEGLALVERAVQWMGGAEALGAIRTYAESRTVVHTDSRGDFPHEVSLTIEFDPDGRVARAHAGDDWRSHGAWGHVLVGPAAWTVSRQGGSGAMSAESLGPSQRRSLERQADRSLIVVLLSALSAAQAGGVNVCRVSVGDVAGVEVECVSVHARGQTSTLSIEARSGRIVALSHRDRGGAHALLGTREYRFTAWERVGGLLLPTAAEAFFNEEPDPRGSYEGTRVEINGTVDQTWFEAVAGLP